MATVVNVPGEPEPSQRVTCHSCSDCLVDGKVSALVPVDVGQAFRCLPRPGRVPVLPCGTPLAPREC